MTPEQLAQILPMLIGAIIVEGAVLTIMTYFVLKSKGEPPKIEEVFCVHVDGRLISHLSSKGQEYDDDDILSAMLTIVQQFIKDSFGKRDQSDIKNIEFGYKSIFFGTGENIYLALIYTGDANRKMKQKIKDTLDTIEGKYSKTLDNWDGDLDDVKGIADILRPLIGALDPEAED